MERLAALAKYFLYVTKINEIVYIKLIDENP